MLRVPGLTPGPYTLSLQVRADARRLAVQLKDVGDNGAIADYVLGSTFGYF